MKRGKTLTKNKLQDKMSRRNYKIAKRALKNEKFASKEKTAAVKAVSANIANAVTHASANVANAVSQKYATQRQALAYQDAARQATQGGLTTASTSRDEDKTEDENRSGGWIY